MTADAAMFARVFEEHHEGRLVLEALVQKFGRDPYVKGGIEAQRETERRMGQRSVLDHIINQINRAHGVEDSNEPSS